MDISADKDLNPEKPTVVAREERDDNYLGDLHVVDGLVRCFISDMMDRHASDRPKIEKIAADKRAIVELAAVLSGANVDYKPIPSWHQASGLGITFAQHLKIDPNQSYLEICQGAVGLLTLELYEIEKGAAAGVPDQQWQFWLDALIEKFVSLCMGTIEATHPPDEI